MFRVVFFVDDKKLPGALRDLMGVATGSPEVLPVVNGAEKGGKVVAATKGDTCDLFIAYVKKHKLTQVRAPQMRAFCKSAGLAETSYTYFAKQLVAAGCLKKHGKGAATYYTVTKNG